MAEQKLNIHQKLAKIRKQVEVIQKNKDGYGYRYVTDDEILSKISVFMDKYQLSLYPGIVPGTTKVSPYAYNDGDLFQFYSAMADVAAYRFGVKDIGEKES